MPDLRTNVRTERENQRTLQKLSYAVLALEPSFRMAAGQHTTVTASDAVGW